MKKDKLAEAQKTLDELQAGHATHSASAIPNIASTADWGKALGILQILLDAMKAVAAAAKKPTP